jgi:PQQ-dependent dehydrogenase (s-GDH family)
MRVIREHLNFPWEIAWGPDNFLWITERTSFQVSRINPENGDRHVILELSDGYQVSGQDGLLGMALDPGLLQNNGNDYVYISYTYNAADPAAAPDRRQKIVRYTYNPATEQLDFALPLILGLPASLDHNGGRLIFGPDGKLYYSIGDQGANQYDRACELNKAQQLPTAPLDFASYPGKTLRINPDGSVPSDNPVLSGVQSHVFTYGHRNHQGLSFGPDGILYGSEHGPKSDDEINILSTGRNYGWPLISGYRDDRAYAYREWASSSVPCDSLTYSDYSVPPSVPVQTETSLTLDFTEPLTTMFTVDSDHMFLDPACEMIGGFLCWPTIAPSSVTAYEGPLWPGISLLVTSLKHGLLYRWSVTDSTSLDTLAPMPETETQNRYRSLTVSPDGNKIYVVTDVIGASYVSRGASLEIANPGAILEFSY